MEKTAFFTFTPTVSARDENGLPKRFEGVAYSGGVIPGYGWHGDAAIDLASLNLPEGQIFALVDHDASKRAGKLSAQLAGNQILVAGEFFTASEAGREVASLFAEGAPWQMSVGIQAKTESGDKRTVQCNGQTLSVDTLFKNAFLREVSFVPVGADPNTRVAAFAARAFDPLSGDDAMSEELKAEIATLVASLDEAKHELTALRQFKAEARNGDIKHLQDDLLLDLKDEEINEFSAMSDKTFAMVTSQMRIARQRLAESRPHLLIEQATGGTGTGTAPGQAFSVAQGFSIDAERLALHAKILDYARTNQVTYDAAAAALSA